MFAFWPHLKAYCPNVLNDYVCIAEWLKWRWSPTLLKLKSQTVLENCWLCIISQSWRCGSHSTCAPSIGWGRTWGGFITICLRGSQQLLTTRQSALYSCSAMLVYQPQMAVPVPIPVALPNFFIKPNESFLICGKWHHLTICLWLIESYTWPRSSIL